MVKIHGTNLFQMTSGGMRCQILHPTSRIDQSRPYYSGNLYSICILESIPTMFLKVGKFYKLTIPTNIFVIFNIKEKITADYVM